MAKLLLNRAKTSWFLFWDVTKYKPLVTSVLTHLSFTIRNFIREVKAMSIKPMLVRLEGAMDRNDLIEQMVLLPEPASAASKWANATTSVNLIVGYNASPRSQTALDLTMWIAHQTRLATQKNVTVQVVYVVEQANNSSSEPVNSSNINPASNHRHPGDLLKASISRKASTSVLDKPKPQRLAVVKEKKSSKQDKPQATVSQADIFEKADRILWQARCLAEEWRGAFKAHLRFGNVANELKAVVEAEDATLLLLGCNSAHHYIVEQLGHHFPCAVLGIPQGLMME
jgi:nucleotide-binding universal stress UspA family protein